MTTQGRWKRTRDKITSRILSKYVDLHPSLVGKLLAAMNENINQRKTYKSGPMSKISQQLFETIHCDGARWGKKTDTNKGELMVKLAKKNAMIDFSLGNTLIKFHGDYWHANPIKTKPTDLIFTGGKLKKVAAEFIWARDAARIQELESLGYKVLIIWENEFKQQPLEAIEKCKNFLIS